MEKPKLMPEVTRPPQRNGKRSTQSAEKPTFLLEMHCELGVYCVNRVGVAEKRRKPIIPTTADLLMLFGSVQNTMQRRTAQLHKPTTRGLGPFFTG